MTFTVLDILFIFNKKKQIMKSLILSLFLSLFSLTLFSQNTLVDLYVINQNNCPYTITSTWSSQTGGGHATVLSVDTMINQNIWHLQVPDSSFSFEVCAIPVPACNCPIECFGPVTITNSFAITLVLCSNNVEVDELNILEIENPMVGVVVVPMSESANFYLINSESKIVKWAKNTTTPSFNSDELQSGFYYLVLETQTNKKIYKLIKQ